VDSIGTALARELVARPFPHGTATASVAADRVPELRLVLVELALIGASAMRDPFECPTQADVDLAAALLADADVRAAYVGRPVSSLDRQLRELRSAHGVGAVNESFGPLSRLGLEELAYDSGCGRLSFAAYFDAFTAGERGHEEAHPEPGVLWVRAAGNEGAALNDGADSTRCRIGDPSQMLVGSYGADGAHSYFTNFGDCVDVFVPGEDVVAALPGDWLFPLDGTSFAAPLALRLALFQAPAPFAPATAREALLALREPSRNIPRTRFPSDLALDVRVATGTSPLTAAGAGGGTTAPAATARRARPPAAAAVRRALWPLRWTRRHHR
jgi:subtilisin family serine protease